MSRRTILILIFVFGIVLLSIVGVVFILQQNEPTTAVTDGENGAPAPDGVDSAEPVETIPPLVEVVVSLQTVPRGHQMTADILALDMRPMYGKTAEFAPTFCRIRARGGVWVRR